MKREYKGLEENKKKKKKKNAKAFLKGNRSLKQKWLVWLLWI